MSSQCGWCGASYARWQGKCDACGGRMPPMPGMELGEEPPPAPRVLPRGFARRQYIKNNVASIIGLVLLGMGGFMGLPLLLINPWFALFPAVLVGGGLLCLRHGITRAREVLRAFRVGLPARGHVVAATRETAQSHNGEHPWRLHYEFTLEGEAHQGSLLAFDNTIGKLAPRQPLWVLHLRDDPSINTVYPPFR